MLTFVGPLHLRMETGVGFVDLDSDPSCRQDASSARNGAYRLAFLASAFPDPMSVDAR